MPLNALFVFAFRKLRPGALKNETLIFKPGSFIRGITL